MKATRFIFLLGSMVLLFSSCSVFSSNKRGCPAGGVGAEKYLDGSKVGKTKKFRG